MLQNDNSQHALPACGCHGMLRIVDLLQQKTNVVDLNQGLSLLDINVAREEHSAFMAF